MIIDGGCPVTSEKSLFGRNLVVNSFENANSTDLGCSKASVYQNKSTIVSVKVFLKYQ